MTTNHSTQLTSPLHVGIIMDGNGTWATKRNRIRSEGHREGANAVRRITRAARKAGVSALTLYAFSAQNWARPIDEVGALMSLLRDYLLNEREELLSNGIRLRAIGELSRLPAQVQEPLYELINATATQTGMTLTLALSYGGQEEIVAAVKKLAHQATSNRTDIDNITVSDFQQYLWSGDLPPLDLVIRTRGEQRISNFMLWHAAYAEFVFTDVLWPDFTESDFTNCLKAFSQRERRFGEVTPKSTVTETSNGHRSSFVHV